MNKNAQNAHTEKIQNNSIVFHAWPIGIRCEKQVIEEKKISVVIVVVVNMQTLQ